MPQIRSLPIVLTVMVILLACSSWTHAADPKYKRTIERYSIPDVVLVNQNGSKVRLQSIVQSGKPVIVDFVFGTCTTICPILSAGFANLQQKLGANAQNVHLISISIDPENDTPKVMKEYLKRYRAKPGWDFLTGSRADIDKVMYAFNAYIANKMYHYPLTIIKPAGETSWIRIYGLLSSSEFMIECNKAGIH